MLPCFTSTSTFLCRKHYYESSATSKVVSYMVKSRNRILISVRSISLHRNSTTNTNTLSLQYYRNETRRWVTALTCRQFQELQRRRMLPDMQLWLHRPPTDIKSISTLFSQFRSTVHKYAIFCLSHK